MVILLTAVNEEIGDCFVGAFDDNKVSAIPELPSLLTDRNYLYRLSAEESESIERISRIKLVYSDKYGK